MRLFPSPCLSVDVPTVCLHVTTGTAERIFKTVYNLLTNQATKSSLKFCVQGALFNWHVPGHFPSSRSFVSFCGHWQ
jgi:hypothetical protein